MGCDIHLYREKQVNGEWVAVDKWTPYDYGDGEVGKSVEYEDCAYTGRNYQLFGVLSKGVRSDHEFSLEPRGIPSDSCKEIMDESKSWDLDGHAHSHIYLSELKELAKKLEGSFIKIRGMKCKDQLAALQESIDSGSPNWDLLFPYCQSTSMENHIKFEIDVPASYYIGDSLKQIIDSFDGVDGDNHRIVFFFDN